jgi:adenylate cyclase
MTIERAEKALAKDPANAPALASGSSALAALGERDRAMDWLERALLLDPDNILMRYNLACALTVDLHDDDRALEVMQDYFERTVSPTHIRHADADPDLDRLRTDPRFNKMVHEAKERLGMAAEKAGA